MAQKYRAIEDLIFRGFLTTKVEVSGTLLVVKSLNHHELAQISLRCPLRSNPSYESVFEAYILAYALYMVDGESVLRERASNMKQLYELAADLPPNVKQTLLREAVVLQRTLDVTLSQVEAYSLEDESRHLWRTYKGKQINDSRLTGIEGTELLGVNTHQIAWIYLNEEEDERLAVEQQWGFAKFVASATNSKGVKQIEEKDRHRLKLLAEERERIKNGEPPQTTKKVEARTTDELRAQLMADLSGQKDLHDQIIDAFETSMQKRRQEAKERYEAFLEEKRREHEEEYNNMTDEDLAKDGGFITVLTEEQLQKRNAERDQQRLDFARQMQERRRDMGKTVQEHKQGASQDVQRMLEKQGTPPPSLSIPTTPRGPAPPPDNEFQYAPKGPAKQEGISGAGPSRRLVQHAPTPSNPRKSGHMTSAPFDEEDDFLSGGSTTYNDIKRGKS